MQKIFPIFLFLAIGAFAQAQPEHGIPVRVKLLSGAEQDAELLRVAQDTVFLGGSIDGKFTVVHLHKNAFAWIGDSSGAHLNLDSLQQTGIATAPADTAAAEQHPEWKGKVLIFPTEYRAIDSALASRVSDITKQMFLDKGKHTVPLSRADYASCKTTDCVFAEVRKNGASAVILESIRPAKSQDSIVLGMSFCDFAAGNCGADSAVLSSRSATEELLKGNRFVNLFAKATGDSSAQAGGSAPDAKQRKKISATSPSKRTPKKRPSRAKAETHCATRPAR